MNETRQSSTRLAGRHALLIGVSLLVWASATYGQSDGGTQRAAPPCVVDNLRLRIATGDDDLRGGSDNLNVTVRFGESGFQGAANVNKGAGRIRP